MNNTKENNINEYFLNSNNMQLEIVKIEELYITFILKGIDNAFANSLRRILIGGVPTIAIDDIKIRNNTSVINDEMLSHRIGLIPLSYSSELEENGRFILSITCPNDSDIISVKSSDLKYMSVSEDIKPLYDDILLVKLKPGQQIDLEAYCKKGVGSEHSKYSPVSTVTYNKKDDDFVFNVECIGTIQPELLIKKALNMLNKS